MCTQLGKIRHHDDFKVISLIKRNEKAKQKISSNKKRL